jgi:hypothetical protein
MAKDGFRNLKLLKQMSTSSVKSFKKLTISSKIKVPSSIKNNQEVSTRKVEIHKYQAISCHQKKDKDKLKSRTIPPFRR